MSSSQSVALLVTLLAASTAAGALGVAALGNEFGFLFLRSKRRSDFHQVPPQPPTFERARYGSPALIHATMRLRSASLGFGPLPMGNCFATGEAAQFQLGSCVMATPHRIAALSLSTMACTV